MPRITKNTEHLCKSVSCRVTNDDYNAVLKAQEILRRRDGKRWNMQETILHVVKLGLSAISRNA